MKKDLKFSIELGKRVREARKAKGYTIEHLAELADMAPQYISEVERGKKTFGAENLRAVSMALGRSTDYFIYGGGSDGPKRAIITGRGGSLAPVGQEEADKLLESLLNIMRDALEAEQND